MPCSTELDSGFAAGWAAHCGHCSSPEHTDVLGRRPTIQAMKRDRGGQSTCASRSKAGPLAPAPDMPVRVFIMLKFGGKGSEAMLLPWDCTFWCDMLWGRDPCTARP